MKIIFEIGGREVGPDDIADAFMAAALEAVEDGLREKIGSIRDPETGEFPVVVVRGRDLDSLSVEVEGSDRLLSLVRAALGEDDGEEEGEVAGTTENAAPVAFLCHGSEDKDTVRRLATDLMAAGIDVFFDEWEIRSGQSLRQKIDEGLGRCTHFIAVLSPSSVGKPWVNAEMDAAFVLKMASEVTFIPLRLGLEVREIPILLQGIHSPPLNDYDADLASLVSDIYGISRKPTLGPAPEAVSARSAGIGLSPAAERIVRLMVDRSEHGDAMDPQLTDDALREATGFIDDDIVDAVDELEGQGFVRKHAFIGSGSLGFSYLTPEGELFAKFDRHFMPWDPGADAAMLAARLLETEHGSISVPEAAKEFGWDPRRMNPAVNYLTNRRLVEFGRELGSHPWTTLWLSRNAATRRFARDRGGR